MKYELAKIIQISCRHRLDLVSDLDPANYTDPTGKSSGFRFYLILKKVLPIVVQPAAVMVPTIVSQKIPKRVFFVRR